MAVPFRACLAKPIQTVPHGRASLATGSTLKVTVMTADDFNPYHQWLGLDAQLRQPNYYQLLGVHQGEIDAQKVSAAADWALARVQGLQPGAYAAQWARLQYEIAAAKQCLTDPAKRAEYDRQLTSSQAAAPTGYRRPAPRDKTSFPMAVPMSPNVPPPGSASVPAPSVPQAQTPTSGASPTVPVGRPVQTQPALPTAQPTGNIPTGVPVGAAGAGPTAASGSASPGVRVGKERSASVIARKRADRSKMIPLIATVMGTEPNTDSPDHAPVEPQPIPTDTSDSLSVPASKPEGPDSVVTPIADMKPAPEQPANPFESQGALPQTKVSSQADAATQQKPEPAPVAKPKREEVETLASALKAARTAVENYDFDGASAELAKVDSLPKLPEHRAKVERLDLLVRYTRQFRSALLESINNLEAGSGIKVGTDEVVAVVSATSERITLRVRGLNRTYALNDLPAGLAVAIADTWLDQNDPVSLASKAAFVASLKDASDDQLAKAREWFQEAAKQGVNIGDLAKVIDDIYDLQ